MRLLQMSAVMVLTTAFTLGVTGAVDTDKSGKNIIFSANAEWKTVDMTDIQVKKGTALDLTAISENGPAGKHGRLIVSMDGKLAFEDSPTVPRRFLAYNGFFSTFKFLDDPDKNVVQQRFVKRQFTVH
jgi:hypothetical protein